MTRKKLTISVERISKKYQITHETREQYFTLRDAIMARFRTLTNKISIKSPEESSRAHKGLEEFWALKDISFQVTEGSRIGIIGRNGAGKSTLLKVLSKITEPTSGRASIKGRIISLLEVGTGFHPELTGKENIFLNGAILGMRRAEIKTKFDAIVDFANIERFLDTPVKRYSSGMYVRLAFSIAAHLDADILLVDEVLAVGDLEFQKKCIEKMSQIATDGKTILFVSHNLSVIASFCETGIVLDNGKIIMMGSVNEALSEYKKLTNTVSKTEQIGQKPTGLLRLISIKAVDSGNNPIEFVKSGNPVELVLQIENIGKKAGLASIHYALHTEDNIRLFYCGTDLAGRKFRANPGLNSFRLEIPRFPFPGGIYHHFIVICFDGQDSHRIPDGGELLVAPGDFFTTAADPPSKLGLILVDHNWK